MHEGRERERRSFRFERIVRRNADERQAGCKGQTLGVTERDPQAGEAARTAADRDRGEIRERAAAEHLVDQRETAFERIVAAAFRRTER